MNASYAVKRIVGERPLLQEGLRQGIISYAALAERLKPAVEQQTGKEASDAAIIMALRRHSEGLKSSDVREIRFAQHTELILKTNLVYFSAKRSPQLFRKLEALYRSFNRDTDDTFNVINGNHEISIITNEKNEGKVADALGSEHLTTKERNLVSISMNLEKDFAYTPGVLFAVTRKLYWDNINIFEVVTTATELTLIFQKKDSMRAYASIEELVEEKSG